MRSILCIVFHPPGLVAVLSALLTLHKEDQTRAAVLCNFPGAAAGDHEEIERVCRELLQPFPSVIHFGVLLDPELESWIRESRRGLSERLRRASGLEAVDEILYCHDVGGHLFPAVAYAFPKARRVACGESFGIYVERRSFERFMRGRPSPKECLRRTVRDLRAHCAGSLGLAAFKGFRHFSPALAALILPVDQFGDLSRIPLRVCPRQVAIEVLERMRAHCGALREYLAALAPSWQGRQVFLLLGENFVEQGRLSAQRETEMYAEFILRHCPSGSVVLFKAHPGSRNNRFDGLQRMLADSHTLINTDQRFRRYPVELWMGWLPGVQVISASYPVLSLKHFADLDVTQPLNEENVRKYFAPSEVNYQLESLRLYMEPLRRLSTWGGQGILYG